LNHKGKVYSFGKGSNGRLGLGKPDDIHNTKQNSELRSDDSTGTYIPPLDHPELIDCAIPAFKQIVHISTGCRHAAAISKEG
jgi:alpha-tubulin suppressor-like RCC1 family protein